MFCRDVAQFRDVRFIWKTKLNNHLLDIYPWFICSFHLFAILFKTCSQQRGHTTDAWKDRKYNCCAVFIFSLRCCCLNISYPKDLYCSAFLNESSVCLKIQPNRTLLAFCDLQCIVIHRGIGVARGGLGGNAPPKIFGTYCHFVLIICLNSSILAPPKIFLGWLRYCTEEVSICVNVKTEKNEKNKKEKTSFSESYLTW